MSKVLELFDKKHAQLRDGYRDESGDFSDSSTLVALDIAEVLKNAGEDPSIVVIRGTQDLTNPYILRRETLQIKECGGLEWGAHVVCVSSGFVYDPILNTPMPFDSYFDRIFDQTVELEDYTSILESSASS